MEIFRGRRFASLETVEFLNYQHTELLFIGAKEDIVDELGKEGSELFRLEEQEEKELKALGDDKLFQDLKMQKDAFPVQRILLC